MEKRGVITPENTPAESDDKCTSKNPRIAIQKLDADFRKQAAIAVEKNVKNT
jgi:hypothetical protein